MASMNMSLAIIIVSYNVRELLRGCLASVTADLARTPDLDGRVVVVDNASADGSARMVNSEFPHCELISLDINSGFAGGNNVALRALGFGNGQPEALQPQAVLLLNPDTEVQPGALGTMAAFLDQYPLVGGCGARLNYADGNFQHSAFRFPDLTQLYFDFYPANHRLMNSRLNGRYARQLYDGNAPFPIDFALGAALMVRAEAIVAAGLMDEAYFMYAEEMDWCKRFADAGWPLYCVPTARITHYEGQSTRQFKRSMTVALWRSRLRYYDKYYSPQRQRAARWLIARGMASEANRTRSAHLRGEISTQEMDERLHTYEQIQALLPDL